LKKEYVPVQKAFVILNGAKDPNPMAARWKADPSVVPPSG